MTFRSLRTDCHGNYTPLEGMYRVHTHWMVTRKRQWPERGELGCSLSVATEMFLCHSSEKGNLHSALLIGGQHGQVTMLVAVLVLRSEEPLPMCSSREGIMVASLQIRTLGIQDKEAFDFLHTLLRVDGSSPCGGWESSISWAKLP